MSKPLNRAARKKAERAKEQMSIPGQNAPQRGQPVPKLVKFGQAKKK